MKRIVTTCCARCGGTCTGYAGEDFCSRCTPEPLPVARVCSPWWRRMLALWRSRRELPSPTLEVRIPEFAGGGSVHVLAGPCAMIGYCSVHDGPVAMPIPAPGSKRLG